MLPPPLPAGLPPPGPGGAARRLPGLPAAVLDLHTIRPSATGWLVVFTRCPSFPAPLGLGLGVFFEIYRFKRLRWSLPSKSAKERMENRMEPIFF